MAPKPLLTDAQLQKIKDIIAKHHTAFIATAVAPDSITDAVKEQLTKEGYIKTAAKPINSIHDAYIIGQAIQAAKDPAVANMSYGQMKEYVKANPIPLSAYEKRAIKNAQSSAGQYAVGLGNKIDQQTGSLLIEADHVLRAKTRDTIKQKVSENIARRESIQKLKSDLGHAVGDWTRDWDRIAKTEKQNAMQMGIADHIMGKDGGDARVAKRVAPDCCDHCRRLYVGPDGAPRIFRLADLLANGSNFKLKTGDWKPVVGAVHPNCRCQLINVPAGWGFDASGRLSPGGELGVEYMAEDDDLERALQYEDDLRKAAALGGVIQFQGLPIVIESDVGSVRKWVDEAGAPGETRMLHAYGFIQGFDGIDGDDLDCYLGPYEGAPNVFVVHQLQKRNGMFDELKCFLGFASESEAKQAYLAHADPKMFGWIDTMPMDQFLRLFDTTSPHPAIPAAPRFVIKSGGPPAGITGTAANNPVVGTATNFLVGTTPSNPKPTTVRQLQPDDYASLVLRNAPKGARKQKRRALYRKKKDWEDFDRFAPVRPFDLPDQYIEASKDVQADAPQNKRNIEARYQRERSVTRNTADPTKSKRAK